MLYKVKHHDAMDSFFPLLTVYLRLFLFKLRILDTNEVIMDDVAPTPAIRGIILSYVILIGLYNFVAFPSVPINDRFGVIFSSLECKT